MTVLGVYTIAELKDLIKAKDFDTAATQASWDGFKNQWQLADRSASNAWIGDWNALMSRYASAKTDANALIAINSFSPVPDNLNPADAAYHEVLTALQKVDGLVSPGDFSDLFNRLSDALRVYGQKPVNETGLPQPSKGSDVDLTGYQAAGNTLKNLGLPKSPTTFLEYVIGGVAAVLFGAILITRR